MSKLSDFIKNIARQFQEFTPDEEDEKVSRAVSVLDIVSFLDEKFKEENPSPEPVIDSEGNPVMAETPDAGTHLLDIFVDKDGTFAIFTRSDGQLYKMQVHVDDKNVITTDPEEKVSMEFTQRTTEIITVKREADNRIRWFAMPACTAVLNRSGEIDSTALFDSFVEHVDRTQQYPVLDFYHMGEKIVLGQADWVARDGVTYCASGLFDDTPIGRAAAEALIKEPGFWGLSIAYVPTSKPTTIRSVEGISIPVYSAGINRFISLLPEGNAASILTSISMEVSRMKTEVMDALKRLVGDNKDLLKEFELKIDSVNRTAEGMISRDTSAILSKVTETKVTENSAPAPVTPDPKEVRATQLDEATINGIIGQMLASPEFDSKIKELVAVVIEGKKETPETPVAPTPAEIQVQKSVEDMTDSMRTISAQLTEMAKRLDGVEKGADEKVREVVDNLPSKVTSKTIYRPRATMTPETVKERNAGKRDLAAIAERTLETLTK